MLESILSATIEIQTLSNTLPGSGTSLERSGREDRDHPAARLSTVDGQLGNNEPQLSA